MSRAKTFDYESGPVVWPQRPPVPFIKGQEMIGFHEPAVVQCTAAEDVTRQEYALQADLAYQVQRFGVGHHLVSGEVDFDNLDLTRALALVEESSQQWLQLPKVVRDRYQSWANVEKAAISGELAQVLKAAGVAEVPSDAAAASASASAPEGSPKAS